MLNNSFYKRSTGLAILIAFCFWFASASAAEFTADVNHRLHGQDLTGKIFVKGDKYRLEQQDGNNLQMLIIVDQKTNMTIVADPAEKNYMETPSQGVMSLMNDPFQSARSMETKHKKILLGEEMISGIECRKLKFESQGQEMMTVWKSKKLGFVLKITLPDKKKSFIQLKNIKEGAVDEVVFQVPVGYVNKEDARKEAKKKREREKAALNVLTTTVSGSAPWSRRIGQGGEIRVKVDSKKSVRFKMENLIKEESIFTITAFRNNKPIKMDIEKTYSLKLEGRRLEKLLGLQNRADEVSVKVDKGKIIAGITLEKSSFAKDKIIKSFFIMTGIRDSEQSVFVDTRYSLRLSITSDSQDSAESGVKLRFIKGGTGEDKIIDEAEVVLKNGQTKSWTYPMDKGIQLLKIEVARGGGVKVRIEQPASEKAVAAKTAPPKKAAPKNAPKIVRTTPSKQTAKFSSKTSRSKPASLAATGNWVKPPAEVAAGASFAIEWKGPNNQSDYITIVKPGAADSEYAEYAYTSAGSPARLHAPAKTGTYQVRYVLDKSRMVIARADFVVAAVSASVTAPASVKAGADFTVSWQGPNYPSDYITIVPAGSPDAAYTSYAYTSSGSSVTLKAPVKPGSYEVRYIVDKSRTAPARTPVTVR